MPHAVHLVISLHICIIPSKMHARKSFKSSGPFFPFPFSYESPGNVYWGPSAQEAGFLLLWASQRRARHGPCPSEVYPRVKAKFKKKFLKIITAHRFLLIFHSITGCPSSFCEKIISWCWLPIIINVSHQSSENSNMLGIRIKEAFINNL